MAKITEFQDGMRCTYSDIEEMLREMNKNSGLPTRHQYQEMKETLPKKTYQGMKDKQKPVKKKEKETEYKVQYRVRPNTVLCTVHCKDKLEVVDAVQNLRRKHGLALKIELFFKGKSVGTL